MDAWVIVGALMLLGAFLVLDGVLLLIAPAKQLGLEYWLSRGRALGFPRSPGDQSRTQGALKGIVYLAVGSLFLLVTASWLFGKSGGGPLGAAGQFPLSGGVWIKLGLGAVFLAGGLYNLARPRVFGSRILGSGGAAQPAGAHQERAMTALGRGMGAGLALAGLILMALGLLAYMGR